MVDKNIVLLHGWGANSKKLKPLGKELEKLEWRVFIPKLPGFELGVPREIWGIGDYARYVLKKARKYFCKDSFYIFGHSFGGRIAIKMAVDIPNISGVILCATGGISRGNPFKRAIFFILAKAGKALLIIPPGARFWRKLLYKLAREHDYEKAQGVMREVFKKVISEDLRSSISKIQLPTLVLWGEEDQVTPISDGKFIKSKLPGAKFVSFRGQGHKLPYKKPAEIAQEIEKWAYSNGRNKSKQ
jgi:pimeloyl-ACP methyl ester carboxylesterase